VAGLATFDAADVTLAQKLSAIVAVAGTDAVGTSVVFNHEGNAYVYVNGNGVAGVHAGDALIKLNNVTANGLSMSGGSIDNVILQDDTAPVATITGIAFDETTNTLSVAGEHFDTLLGTGESAATNLKANLDWSKLSFSLNSDSGSAAVNFARADIASVKVANDGELKIVLTADKGAALKAASGYGAPVTDAFSVTAGFLKDRMRLPATFTRRIPCRSPAATCRPRRRMPIM
jgi:hypothetical protein